MKSLTSGGVSSDAERKRKKRKFIAVVALTAFGFCAVWLLTWPYYRLNINANISLPGVLYLIVIQKENWNPEQGDLVIFWPPRNPVYKDGSRFVKIIKGMPGDTLRFEGNSFYIGNELLGIAKPFSTSGRELKKVSEGKIPDDHYFVWTPHADSYDSRYAEIGFISRARIFGTAHRLF